MAHAPSSMTGFARAAGAWRGTAFAWELKSVNGKALDIRFRLPPGLDQLEAPARAKLQAALKRGNVQVNLSLQSADGDAGLRINTPLLEQLIAEAERLRDRLGSAPIQAENLLALRGVLDTAEPALAEDEAADRDTTLLAALDQAIAQLQAMRLAEGTRLAEVLRAQVDRIEALTHAARDNPARTPEAIRQRLAEQVARIVEQSSAFDEQRLHQEAVLAATRADIQEELDRLAAHIAAARALLKQAEPVGRKFDFLTQEFNREANTLCSKAADVSLSAIGLDLKTVIDQMREQVQNIE